VGACNQRFNSRALSDIDLATCSIIAIHGLNGDAARTWTDPTTEKLWLKDFLPNMCPLSRIMSFGYNSTVALSNSTAGIEDYARDLLNRVNGMRQSVGIQALN
jgi:hypothetical protein